MPQSDTEFSEFVIQQLTINPHNNLWRIYGYNMRSIEIHQRWQQMYFAKETGFRHQLYWRIVEIGATMSNSASSLPPLPPDNSLTDNDFQVDQNLKISDDENVVSMPGRFIVTT